MSTWTGIAVNPTSPAVVHFEIKSIKKSQLQGTMSNMINGKVKFAVAKDEERNEVFGIMYYAECEEDELPNQVAMKFTDKKVRGLVVFIANTFSLTRINEIANLQNALFGIPSVLFKKRSSRVKIESDIKNESRPKAHRTAYNMFVIERKKGNAKNCKWSELTLEEKTVFEELSDIDKFRATNEFYEYSKRLKTKENLQVGKEGCNKIEDKRKFTSW